MVISKIVGYMNENFPKVEYYVCGEKNENPPLLFLHGLGAHPMLYKKFINHFGKDYLIYFPTLPGHGKTLAPEWFLSDDENEMQNNFVKFLEEFVEFTHIDKPFTLFGHSLGGALSVLYTNKNQSIVRKLVIVDSAGLTNPSSRTQRLWAKLKAQIDYFIHSFSFPLITLIYAWKHRKSQKMISSMLMRSNIIEVWKKLKIDTSIYWGSKDLVTPIEFYTQFKSSRKNVTGTILTHKDHNWILYNPRSIKTL